jgi:hypothetical protein
MSTIKKTAENRSRATSAAAPRQARGTLTKKQKWTLLDYARKAYAAHQEADLTDGLKFDAWRKREVIAAVGKDGLTACNNGDFLPVKSHFQTLAGDLAGAFDSALKSNKPTDHAAPGDTIEARRKTVHLIAQELEAHIYIATHTEEQILADSAARWAHDFPDEPKPDPDPDWLRKLRERKAAIDERGKGPIDVGYIIYITRQKTRRPNLTLGKDWKTGLVDRCTTQQLDQILYTLVNRINAVEGVEESEQGRNKKQKSPVTKAAKKAAQETPRW